MRAALAQARRLQPVILPGAKREKERPPQECRKKIACSFEGPSTGGLAGALYFYGGAMAPQTCTHKPMRRELDLTSAHG